MAVLTVRSWQILKGDSGQKHTAIYRGILECLARFGYASTHEIRYGFNLSYKATENRLTYLSRLGLVRKFPSETVPPVFYCLTSDGRQMARDFGISDSISDFVPSQYAWGTQRHHRTIVMA